MTVRSDNPSVGCHARARGNPESPLDFATILQNMLPPATVKYSPVERSAQAITITAIAPVDMRILNNVIPAPGGSRGLLSNRRVELKITH